MNNKKIYIWISIILILGLLSFLTYAWVRSKEYSDIDNSDVAVSVGNNIEVSLTGDAGSFSDAVNLNFNQVNLNFVAGNGFDFYAPTVTPPVYDLTTGWRLAYFDDPVEDDEYIKFSLYFRAPTDVDLYLSKKSYILPSTDKRQIGIDSTVITEDDIVNKSTNGPFTRDYIAGASRLAILSENEEITSEIESEKYTITKLWVPNISYHLIEGTGQTYTFDENSSTLETQFAHSLYKDGSNIFRLGSFDAGLVDTQLSADRSEANGDTAFASIIGTNDTDLVTKHVVIKVWIDGTDREAKEPLLGGDVKINLQFVGIKRS